MVKRKTAPLSLQQKIKECAAAALDKKAEKVVSLDLRKFSGFAEAFLICNGTHPKQNQAIAQNIYERLRELGAKPIGMEGEETGAWILIDTGDLVVHVFDEQTRSYYDLERLWADAPRRAYSDEPPAPKARAAQRG